MMNKEAFDIDPIVSFSELSLLIYDLDMVSKRFIRYCEMCSSLKLKEHLLNLVVQKENKEIR